MANVTLSVPGSRASTASTRLTEALTPVPGVRRVQVDIPAKLVQLDYDDAQLSLDQVKEILADEDYPVASVR